MRTRVIAAAALLLLASVSGAEAASGEASILFGRSYVEELLLNDQASFGGTIGVFSSIVGFELGVDYMPTSDFVIPGVNLGSSVLNVAGNVVLQAPLASFVPYGTVGYGGLFANASRGLDSDEFLGMFGAFNYGLGAKYFFDENVGIRLDYRRYAIQTDEDDPRLEIPLGGESIQTEPDLDRFFVGLALRW
jgi:hypothetical protein